ncbi:sel1 repeat family protein [Pseudomonas entomophila]|uniref:tetratricopeptide repeat protein n=1 Tax=Pseudomonas entomophila TaxID=312306 RepID=UPI0015E30BC2|nr:tetratricopeptide repeat protein [Pseudomonas entomophila]MBA1189784.1 sel1 repeat family protein [Pseudomonas entomophila]
MNRTGRALSLGCLLLLQPLAALAEGGNSLLIPTTGRCTFDTRPQDVDRAIKACEQLATSGDAQAQYELAELYHAGDQVPKDLHKALDYYEQASLLGHAEAQSRLGAMFFQGEGVAANKVQAYILLKMAAVNGAEDALDMADEVSASMPREELERATQVLGQIFRKYLLELQSADGRTPFSPLP